MATLVATAKATNANSYCTLAEANTFMETVRPEDETIWLQRAEATRERLLIMSTRLIDQHWIFMGFKSDVDQALLWPRTSVLVDGKFSVAGDGKNLDADTIPSAVKNATAELARILVGTDVTADPDLAGFKQVAVAGMAITTDSKDRYSQGVMRSSVYSFLRKYGSYKPGINSGGAALSVAKVSR